MFSKTHYRPLPKGVKIAKSSIDGHGLFATADIPKNTDLGMGNGYVDKNTVRWFH